MSTIDELKKKREEEEKKKRMTSDKNAMKNKVISEDGTLASFGFNDNYSK